MNRKQEELVLHLPGRSECRTVASLRNRPMFYYGDDPMALEFEGSANPAIVGFNRFERLTDLVGIEQSAIEREVWHTVETIRRLAGMLPNQPAPPGLPERMTTRGATSLSRKNPSNDDPGTPTNAGGGTRAAHRHEALIAKSAAATAAGTRVLLRSPSQFRRSIGISPSDSSDLRSGRMLPCSPWQQKDQ